MIGWGQTTFDNRHSVSEVLRHTVMKTIPLNECNRKEAFNNTVTSDQSVCGKGKDFSVSPCTKDSGGGLACKKDGMFLDFIL